MELLSLIAGVSVATIACLEGKQGGIVGILIGLLLGLPAGFGVFWATRITIKKTIIRHGLYEAQLSPARLALAWGLIAGTFFGVVIAGVAVIWLMRLIVRHL